MASRRAISLAVLTLLAAGAGRPREARAIPTACTAADIIAANAADCPNNSNPCLISKDFIIGNGCTLDFGTRTVTLKTGTTFTVDSGAMTLKAGSLTIAPGGFISARGRSVAPNDVGGFVAIQTTGAVTIQKGSSSGRIDVSGNTQAGTIRITAGGTVTLDGQLLASNFLTTSGGGNISIDAGGDVITHLGSLLQATAGTGVSGSVDIRAGGLVDLGDLVDLTGLNGGSLSVDAGTSAVLRHVQSDASPYLDGGSGGDLAVTAGTFVQILDGIFERGTATLDGTSGGTGGTIDMEANFGDLTINANVMADGGGLDGPGGTMTLAAVGSITTPAGVTISARGGGAESCGGELDVSADQNMINGGAIDVSGGGGGGSIDVLTQGAITLNGSVLALGTSEGSSGGDVRIQAGADGFGPIAVNSTVDVSGGICDVFGSCGIGGLADLAGCDLTVAATGTVRSGGGGGGMTLLVAREQLTVRGTVDATHAPGPGTDGSNGFQYSSRKTPVVTGVVSPAATLVPVPTCTAPDVPAGCLSPCPTCGNGVVEFPETCDTSGTPLSCDGCSAFCRLENCDDGNPCTADSCDVTLGCLNVQIPDGTSCSDGLVCNGVEACVSGYCFGTAPNCADTNPCTVDSCVEPTGCQHTNASPGTGCSDGNPCTVGDTCNASALCQPGVPAVCNDNRECTTDTCNPSTGCVFTNRSGACADEGNPCTGDVCNAGNCTHPAVVNGTACNDGAFCTVSDSCQSGICAPGSPRDCSDTSPCTIDTCNEASDTCVHTPQPAGALCNDGNACTVGDTCDAAGACQPGTVATCDDANPCTDDSCNPATGCVHVNRTGACPDDGNACTTDVCTAGSCTHPAVTNGTACSDGAFCTVLDTCQGGTCAPGPARDCSDGNSCTTDTCNEATDTCVHTPLGAGATCTDNDACTVGDACDAGGVCRPGGPANCDDGSECTDDSCNPATGCVHANRAGPCTDDGNQCTTDVCAVGVCTHPSRPNGTTCDDGFFCTIGDSCLGGICTPSGPRTCNDSNTCTADSCNEATDTCDHTPLPGTSCSDNDACTVGDTCNAGGVCQPGGPANCDDGSECTIDSCNSATGCVRVNRSGACTDDGNSCTTDVCAVGVCTHPNRPNGTACDDGLFCTVGDSCQGGTCTPTGARNCGGASACTTGSCNEVTDTCDQTTLHPCCGDGVTEGSEQCDDGNAVDTDACLNNCRLATCGDGVVESGLEDCDLGNANSNAPDAACRTDCHPRRCGDGIVDSQAGEQCDDSNAVGGDGCSPLCFAEPPLTVQRIPGRATRNYECIVEWAMDGPNLDRSGVPVFKKTCVNGDPSCDFGSNPNECLFHLWLCSNNHDARLPLCTPGPGGVGTLAQIEVRRPTAKSATVRLEDAANRNQELRAAASVLGNVFDGCGPRIDIRVPLKSPIVKGSKSLSVKGTATSLLADVDTLSLVCLP